MKFCKQFRELGIDPRFEARFDFGLLLRRGAEQRILRRQRVRNFAEDLAHFALHFAVAPLCSEPCERKFEVQDGGGDLSERDRLGGDRRNGVDVAQKAFEELRVLRAAVPQFDEGGGEGAHLLSEVREGFKNRI
jgi:hypothetical protein